jgi:penicillin amidase
LKIRTRNVLITAAIIVALLVVTPVGLVAGVIGWLKLSPPAMTGEVRLAGLSAAAELIWDRNAVPHIFAGSLRDSYRVLGWVHARDRLWQMEIQRRVGQGRLSEVVGKLGLVSDRQMRVLGLYRLAEASYAALDADTRADLDAYAAGVNAYLTHPAAPLPLEFQLLRVTPEPWRPADSLVWLRLMSLQLSANAREEAEHAELTTQLGPEGFKELFPDAPISGPTTLAALHGVDWRRFAANLPPALGPDHASNEWVVDGTLTRSGKPLLANDPHLGLSAPIMWYLVRIVTPEESLAGVTFPGIPFHILGHNDRIAWGATTTGGDVQDLFVEDIDPADPGRYRTPDGTAAFAVREEIIKVRLGQDVHLTVRNSRHGPVISDIVAELAQSAGKNKAVALAFIGLDPADTTPQAIRQMNRARDWPSFQNALSLWRSPEQNIVYADIDGHIGFTAVGALPIRKAPPDDLPASGSNGARDWSGTTVFAQLPRALDPADHRFINANNRIVPADFPVYIARNYAAPFRAERIVAMLDAGHGYTADDFSRMQLDVKAQDAVELLPRLLQARPQTALGRQALALLSAWDCTMDRERPEPLIYSAFTARLKQTLLVKRMSADLSHRVGGSFSTILLGMLLDSSAAGDAEATHAMLSAALDDSMAVLAKAYGQDLAAWRWGEAHPASLRSQPLGGIPLLGRLFDIGLPVSGGGETVNTAGFNSSADGVHFPDNHGPGYRGVYDLADLNASRFIIATGQSGDALSPHFGDFVRRWRDGDSIRLTGTAAEVAAAGLGRLVFSP